jgi:ArsR family transcriptional regulator, arsenate/arsenite/antimonite-responsive transcriptional repressor / arsenate reductase (thioredoxin)
VKRRSRVPTACAGTRPAKRVHPRAVAAARVVAVCDNAHETDAAFTGALRDLGYRVDRLAPAVHEPGDRDD